MSNLFYFPRQRSIPYARLRFRLSGTSTPQAVYTDADLQVAHSDPVVADADGYFDVIYFDPAFPDYRVIHTDMNDVPLEPTLDDIPASGGVSSNSRIESTAPETVYEETDQSANNKKWHVKVNGNQMSIGPGNDAESVWVDALAIDRDGTVAMIGKSGSFSATVVGMSAPATVTCTWRRTGNIVVLSWPEVTGTSNAVTLTFTGIPSDILPTRPAQITNVYVLDNGGSYHAGIADIFDSGGIEFGNAVGNTTGGFTASGNKRVAPSTIVYMI